MRYLLRINPGYKHLTTKFERAVLTHAGRDGSEMAVCLRSFLFVSAFQRENGLYELANMFCHVGPGVRKKLFRLQVKKLLLTSAIIS